MLFNFTCLFKPKINLNDIRVSKLTSIVMRLFDKEYVIKLQK